MPGHHARKLGTPRPPAPDLRPYAALSGRARNVAVAHAYRASGWFHAEICEVMNTKRSTLSSWLNDPNGTKLRARKDTYRGTCEDCGALTDGSNGRHAAPRFCLACTKRHATENALWTKDTIAAAVRRWVDQYGEVPSASDWSPAQIHWDAKRRARAEARYRGQGWPSLTTVMHVFPSWGDAIRYAGFEARRRGRKRNDPSPFLIARAVHLYAEGASSAVAAAQVGIHPHTVLTHARRCGVPVRPPGGQVAA